METFETILVVVLCAFLLAIHLATQVEIRRDSDGKLKTQIRAISQQTTGKIVYRWLVNLIALVGVFFGASLGIFALLFAAIIAERLVVYRICRPNDFLGKFLTRYNW